MKVTTTEAFLEFLAHKAFMRRRLPNYQVSHEAWIKSMHDLGEIKECLSNSAQPR